MTATVQRFRPRAVEPEAIELSDGRYLVLADPPRYCPKAEWEAAFEPIAVALNGSRGRGHKPPRPAKQLKPTQQVEEPGCGVELALLLLGATRCVRLIE